MPRFNYRATSAEGNEVTGEVTAARPEEAVAMLGRAGLQVSWLSAAPHPPPPAARGLTAPEQMAFFNSQLAAMTKAGIPVSQGIRALAADLRRGRLRRALDQVARDLDGGASLDQAFQAQRHLFPRAYGHLMEAGARSGNLPAVLLMLSTYSRAIADLRAAVLSALWYPLVVAIFCVVIFVFVGTFVAPNLEVIFKEFDIRLPWITAAVLFVVRHAAPSVVVLAGFVVLVWAVVKAVRHSAGGRAAMDHARLRLPLIGAMLRASLLSRFARTLALLLGGGVPMLEALRLAREALDNADFEDRLTEVERGVAEGQPLGQTLTDRLRGGQVLAWSVSLGEQRGDVVEALQDAAEVYDVETRHRAQVLRTAIQPLLVLFVAGLVAFTTMVMLLPLVRLISQLGADGKGGL
jgi:type II secretory pathway component PulF